MMLGLIPKKETDFSALQEFGTIQEIEGNRFIVESRIGRYRAKRAVSCIQLPGQGDRVLFITDPDGDCYILAVLEKKEQNNRLVFEGDTDFICKGGKVQIACDKGVGLMTTGQVDCTSSDFRVVARKGMINIGQLSFLGTHLLGKIARIKILGGVLESIFDRMQQKMKRCYREVEDTDYLKAERLDYKAEKTMSLHGKYSFVTAEEDVKIDGERIHIG